MGEGRGVSHNPHSVFKDLHQINFSALEVYSSEQVAVKMTIQTFFHR